MESKALLVINPHIFKEKHKKNEHPITKHLQDEVFLLLKPAWVLVQQSEAVSAAYLLCKNTLLTNEVSQLKVDGYVIFVMVVRRKVCLGRHFVSDITTRQKQLKQVALSFNKSEDLPL